jgi:hypothetical protein
MNENLSTHIKSLKQRVLESKEQLLKQSLLSKKRSLTPTSHPISAETEVKSVRSVHSEISPKQVQEHGTTTISESTITFLERFNKRMKVFSEEMNARFTSSSSMIIPVAVAIPVRQPITIEKETIEECNSIMESKVNDESGSVVNPFDNLVIKQLSYDNLSSDNQEDQEEGENAFMELPSIETEAADNSSNIDNLCSKILSTKESLLKNLLRLKRKRQSSSATMSSGSANSSARKLRHMKIKHKRMKVKFNISKMKRSMSLCIPAQAANKSLKTKKDLFLAAEQSNAGVEDSFLSLQSKLMKCKESALKNLLRQRLQKRKEQPSSSSSVSASSTGSSSVTAIAAKLLKAKSRSANISRALKGWANRRLVRRKSLSLPVAAAAIGPSSSSVSLSSKHQHRSSSSDKKFIEKLLDIIRQQKEKLHIKKKVSSSSPKPCLFFIRHGMCRELERSSCHFLHDPAHIRLCPQFLNNASCSETDCKLRHEEDPVRALLIHMFTCFIILVL